MEYIITPHSLGIEPFVWWDGMFTVEELDWLQYKAKNFASPAMVGGAAGKGLLNPTMRRSDVSWLYCTPESKIIFEKLEKVITQLNSQYYRFDLIGFGEPVQLTNYDHSVQGMYKWHQDYGNGISRKLSLVMQLSDPSEYEGGSLEIMTSNDPIIINKKRGLITVFPSYTVHQVTPVVRGNRQSLVAWISGAPFR